MSRYMSKVFVWCAFSFCFFPSIGFGQNAFSGKYEGANLSIEIVPDHGAYTGTIRLGGQAFPLTAHEEAGQLAGTFRSQGESFNFNATLQGNSLTLVSGGATYALKQVSPPVNPLATRLLPGAAGDPLAGYRVIATTDTGKALSSQKPQATSVQSALESTFPDLARYFDGRPAISGAFEDSKDHRSGGASFAAKLKGQPVKGFVSCKLGDKGAEVGVVYCRADAPRAEWDKLMTATSPGPSATPEIKLQDYQFPDGTGTIGLAEGWKTGAPSCLQAVVLEGPAEQRVTIGFCASVVTPDSPMLQTQRQLEATARQMGMQPRLRPQMLIAPNSGPVDALKNLVPQFSELSQRNGGPAVVLDNVIDQQKAKANLPNGDSALVNYLLTRTTNGVSKQYRAVAQIETDPILQGSWMFYAVELLAPTETFDRDLPLMLAMAKSMKTNDRVVQEKTRQNIDAQNRNFAEMQQAHREQMDSYDRMNKAWEHRQLTQSRSNADFDEVIRGYRTVEDTSTGERASVDLGNAHDIVNKLNERESGRYKEIPLRDEMYPVTPENK
jgi:hypothetical protein